MIEITNTEVFGWRAAIRGARNPMNSWDKSDSEFLPLMLDMHGRATPRIGENDLKLLSGLSRAGNDHGKFLRMIHVQCDIKAPLYWWKEMDQYKVGTVTNSCSTMHTIHKKEITMDDFSFECLDDYYKGTADSLVYDIEELRKFYLAVDEKHKKALWDRLIQLLPSSYNQLRTWDSNYAVLKNIYHARKNHKLQEWRDFCRWIEELPYAAELIICGEAESE